MWNNDRKQEKRLLRLRIAWDGQKRGKKHLTVIPLSLRVEEIIEQRDDCFAR